VLLYLERDVFSSVQLAHILPAVASIDPCTQQQKPVKLVLPVENLMYSSVNLERLHETIVRLLAVVSPQLRNHCQQGSFM
jgi:type II secretory pathway component PulL